MQLRTYGSDDCHRQYCVIASIATVVGPNNTTESTHDVKSPQDVVPEETDSFLQTQEPTYIYYPKNSPARTAFDVEGQNEGGWSTAKKVTVAVCGGVAVLGAATVGALFATGVIGGDGKQSGNAGSALQTGGTGNVPSNSITTSTTADPRFVDNGASTPMVGPNTGDLDSGFSTGVPSLEGIGTTDQFPEETVPGAIPTTVAAQVETTHEVDPFELPAEITVPRYTSLPGEIKHKANGCTACSAAYRRYTTLYKNNLSQIMTNKVSLYQQQATYNEALVNDIDTATSMLSSKGNHDAHTSQVRENTIAELKHQRHNLVREHRALNRRINKYVQERQELDPSFTVPESNPVVTTFDGNKSLFPSVPDADCFSSAELEVLGRVYAGRERYDQLLRKVNTELRMQGARETFNLRETEVQSANTDVEAAKYLAGQGDSFSLGLNVINAMFNADDIRRGKAAAKAAEKERSGAWTTFETAKTEALSLRNSLITENKYPEIYHEPFPY